ncbi:MAG: DNA-protecting protein DprA [Tepidisphaera sp.]|nr:DNA-protecting protein DprA [Tepidisphaera sp.]
MSAVLAPSKGENLALLELTHVSGLGPTLIRRLVDRSGSPTAAQASSPADWSQIKGMRKDLVASLESRLRAAKNAAQRELDLAESLGVRILTYLDADFPSLLANTPGAPVLLYVRGDITPADRFPVAIVGSRQCSQYGLEQARRFAGSLSGAGLTIVSGGAKGIDAAAHQAALIAKGRTIAVLGCGLSHCYPEEHADLFERIAQHGAVVSELPLSTPPSAENFPMRNRVISGLSLGVLVIEAGVKSGALITAQYAAEEHGRDVMALPGRVDSAASRGSLELLKSGGAALVTDPADVIHALESAARHLAGGTHAARFGFPSATHAPDADPAAHPAPLFEAAPPAPVLATPTQAKILDALSTRATFDQLIAATGFESPRLRAELTMLELAKRVRREGSLYSRTDQAKV